MELAEVVLFHRSQLNLFSECPCKRRPHVERASYILLLYHQAREIDFSALSGYILL